MKETKITSFRGEYAFLSNFYPSEVEMDGFIYPTVENAYQAAKSDNIILRTYFTEISPSRAKKESPQILNKEQWYKKSLGLMYDLILQKFTKHKHLQKKLLDTGTSYIEEGNNWRDRFWRTMNGEGENHLGIILMKVRQQLNK